MYQMPKIPANWSTIDVGDIISFSYLSQIEENAQAKTSTILVLNPKYPKKLKSGKTKYYVNGLKLEEQNITIFSSREETWQLLDSVGTVVARDQKNEIYRVQFHKLYLGGYGTTERLFNELKKTAVGKKAVFRSYLYDTARKFAVFYEPVKLPKSKISELKDSIEVEAVSRTRGGRGDIDAAGGDEKVVDGTILGDIKELLK